MLSRGKKGVWMCTSVDVAILSCWKKDRRNPCIFPNETPAPTANGPFMCVMENTHEGHEGHAAEGAGASAYGSLQKVDDKMATNNRSAAVCALAHTYVYTTHA